MVSSIKMQSIEADIAAHSLICLNSVQPRCAGGLQKRRRNSSTTASSCALNWGDFAIAFSKRSCSVTKLLSDTS